MTHVYGSRRRLLTTLIAFFALSGLSLYAQWTSVGNLNSSRSQIQQAYHNGSIYIFGGGGIPPAGTAYVAGMTTAQKIDASNGSVTDIASLPIGRRGGYAAAVNGKIYIFAGSYANPSTGATTFVTDVHIYDPATNSYTTGMAMPKPLLQVSGCVVGTNVYIMGGLTISGTSFAYSNSTLVYDCISNTWTEINPAPYAPDLGCATSAGGVIYLTGGRTSSGVSALAYKGTINGSLVTWSPLPNIPAGHYGSGAGEVGGNPYVAIGYDASGNESRACYMFNVAQNKWESTYARETASGLLNSMPSSGTNGYLVSGTGTTAIYKLTLGAAKPIAVIDNDKLVLTVRQGAQRQGIIEVGNDGVAPLQCTVAIPTEANWLQTLQPNFTVQPGGKYGINFNAMSGSLAVGKYAADVTLTTNDVDKATTTLKITMWVVDAATPQQDMKLVMEEASGDWCPPCGAYGVPGVRALKSAHGDKIIVISHHDRGGRPSELMHTTESEAIDNWLGVPFFPAASFQRWNWNIDGGIMIGTGNWNTAAQTVFSTQPNAPIALEITSYSYDPATKQINANLKLTTSEAISMTGRTLRYTVYVTEDSINLPQASAPENPFYHMDVTRDIYPDIRGGQITIPAEALDDGGATLKPGYVIELPVQFNVAATYSYVPAKCHTIFSIHVNEGNNPGPVLQGKEIKLTETITGGGGGGYTINIGESYKSITTRVDTASFESTITNNGTAPIDFSVTRMENNLPGGGGWNSWFCLGNDCGTPSDNGPIGPATINPGQSIAVKIKVWAGSNGTGTVKIRFNGPAGAQQEQLYTVSASGGSSVPGIDPTSATLQLGANVPNPAAATTRFTYLMPRPGTATIEVFSVTGELVASLPGRNVEAGAHSIDLDVASLPNGLYTVRISANGAAAQRTISVTR